jgi:hypothetical protein
VGCHLEASRFKGLTGVRLHGLGLSIICRLLGHVRVTTTALCTSRQRFFAATWEAIAPRIAAAPRGGTVIAGATQRPLNLLPQYRFGRPCNALAEWPWTRRPNARSTDGFILRGVPGHIRSDNGPEFIAMAVREWMAVGVKTAYIERGSPSENGYCESFNSNSVTN